MLNLDRNKRYLLACSFGPDSMALFDMLVKENINFEVAHVNYHLREESNFEEESLKSYCKDNGVLLHIFDNNKDIKRNIEEKCREIRYSFFESLISNFDSLLVAHNQDDLIETFLLQEKRNAFCMNYGLKEESYMNQMLIIRPLLNWKKCELKKYCDDNNVPYSIDKTNLEDKFLRNKIRHSIVEKLTDAERDEILSRIESKNYSLNLLKDKLKKIDLHCVEELKKLSFDEFAFALHILGRLVDPKIELSRGFVGEIKKTLSSDKGNISIKINENVTLRKEYGSLNFVNLKNEDYRFVLEKPGILDTDYFYLDFTKDSSNRNVNLEDYPIVIQNAKDKAYYHIGNYDVLVRRLFIDWKMPLKLRKRWPMICNKYGEVIYIPRYRKEFVKTDGLNFYVK